MNDAAHQDEPNRYHFQYQNYNLDGTWKDNPVISLASPPIDVSKFGYPPYVFKTLTTDPAITITDPKVAKPGSYTVYSAVPTSLTVAGAYNNSSSYYPPIPTPANTTGQPHWNLWHDLYFFNPPYVTGDFPGWPSDLPHHRICALAEPEIKGRFAARRCSSPGLIFASCLQFLPPRRYSNCQKFFPLWEAL